MIYGREKYERYQDTTLAKALAGLVLLKLRNSQVEDSHLQQLATEILGLSSSTDTTATLRDAVVGSLIDRGNIPPNEPVFLLRAKDPLAPAAVEYWIARAKDFGVSADRLKSAEQQLNQMKQYATTNGTNSSFGQ